MAYVAKDDIVVFIENEFSFVQGNIQSYEIILYKDFIGNPLNLNEPTSFHVALYSDDLRVIQFSNPPAFGVSAILNIDNANDTGKIDFNINIDQSTNIPAGDLYAEISVIYENYYPRPKTYVFPRLKLGTAINNPNLNNDVDNGDGGENTGGGNNGDAGSGSSINISNGTYTVERTDGLNPTVAGMVSLNSFTPTDATAITFTNLDSNGIRLTALENFLTKRITNEGINGVITIRDIDPTNLYAIYKIESWERVDITQGNGDAEVYDGIKINMALEAQSTGPGVTKSVWEVGQNITFELDAHGITGDSILPDGILTYVDKSINPTPTSGNSAPTGIIMSYSPYQDSYVTIEVNGISVELGDGVTDKDTYFAGSGPGNATRIEEIRAGDELYWNGDIAGFDLEAGDEINLIYEAKSDDLR